MDIDSLLEEIEDELSTDVWYLYGGGRHFAVETLVLQFAASLFLAYAAAFVGVEEIAQRNRKQFLSWLRGVRNEQRAPDTAASPPPAAEAMALLQQAGSSGGDREGAEAEVARLLMDSGMPEALARQHASGIAQVIQRRRGTVPHA